MSANEYFMAWSIYIGASFFVIMFWFWLTSSFRSLTVRMLLRFPVMTVLLLPIQHNLDPSLYTPAVAAAAFAIISKDSMAMSSDITILIAAVVASLLAALLLGFIGRIVARVFFKEEALSQGRRPSGNNGSNGRVAPRLD